jgi:hypothetical protein
MGVSTRGSIFGSTRMYGHMFIFLLDGRIVSSDVK